MTKRPFTKLICLFVGFNITHNLKKIYQNSFTQFWEKGTWTRKNLILQEMSLKKIFYFSTNQAQIDIVY